MNSAPNTTQSTAVDEFAEELLPGTTLLHGQYTIESFLNSGGFGLTYLARDSLFRFPVVRQLLHSWNAVPVDRDGGGGRGLKAILDRLLAGGGIVLFPEGTRMPVGQTRRYGMSGVLLAQAEGLPVVPVTHNAGYFWPRRGWLKRPGTIRVVIGPPIETRDVEPRVVNDRAQQWIEGTLAELGSVRASPPSAISEPTGRRTSP